MKLTRIPVILFFIYAVTPLVSGERRCRYVALDLDPTNGISTTHGIDSVLECCKICLKNPSCKGFAHNQFKACYFKFNQLPLLAEKVSYPTTSGIIEDFEDPPLAPGTERSCWDIGSINVDPGHELIGISAISSYDDCCNQCKANPDCKAFVHNKANMCWLKYNSNPLIPEEPSQFGTHSGIMQVTKIQKVTIPAGDSGEEWPEGGQPVKDKTHCIQLCVKGPVCTEWVFHELSPTPACVLSYDSSGDISDNRDGFIFPS